VIAILAGLYSVWTLVGAGGQAVALGVGLLAIGAPFYWLTRGRSAVRRRGHHSPRRLALSHQVTG
jgi:APA family basic amino acid/polyamine antiporter